MSKERRSEIAKGAADARHSKNLPQARYEGPLNIGGVEFQAAVIEYGGEAVRVVSQSEFMRAGFIAKQHREAAEGGSAVLPMFLAQASLKPFISNTLDPLQLSPISYRSVAGNASKGIPAAEQLEIVYHGLAETGIIALTGYQYARPRRDLEEQLRRFLSENLRAWVRTFPSDYFKHLCRLRGVELRSDMKLPQYFGKLTNNLIYRRIAPGLLA